MPPVNVKHELVDWSRSVLEQARVPAPEDRVIELADRMARLLVISRFPQVLVEHGVAAFDVTEQIPLPQAFSRIDEIEGLFAERLVLAGKSARPVDARKVYDDDVRETLAAIKPDWVAGAREEFGGAAAGAPAGSGSGGSSGCLVFVLAGLVALTALAGVTGPLG